MTAARNGEPQRGLKITRAEATEAHLRDAGSASDERRRGRLAGAGGRSLPACARAPAIARSARASDVSIAAMHSIKRVHHQTLAARLVAITGSTHGLQQPAAPGKIPPGTAATATARLSPNTPHIYCIHIASQPCCTLGARNGDGIAEGDEKRGAGRNTSAGRLEPKAATSDTVVEQGI